MYYVYIALCHDKTLYTGITTDLARRIHEHNTSGRAAAYTAARRPVVLCYHETAADRPVALRRERMIKRLTRAQKLRLIAKATP